MSPYEYGEAESLVDFKDRLSGVSSSVLGNEKSLGDEVPLLGTTGILVISTLSTTGEDVDEEVGPGRFRSMVRPGGIVGVESLDELALLPVEANPPGRLGSSEIVFFRPLLVVPGTLGPVAEDVYLMISVSDGRRSESKAVVAGDEVDVFVADGEEGLAGREKPL